MASAVGKQPAAARLVAVAAAGCLPTATNGRQNSYTTPGDTTPLTTSARPDQHGPTERLPPQRRFTHSRRSVQVGKFVGKDSSVGEIMCFVSAS